MPRHKSAHMDGSALPAGLATVPVRVAADLTPQQARAYRIADNRTNETAEWDVDILPIELGQLRDGGADLKLLGLADKELTEYLREFDTDLDAGQPDAEETRETIHCPKCGHEFPLE